MSDVSNTLQERGSRYGPFSEHAKICQGMIEVMRATDGWHRLDPDMKQALSTICDKIARILNGDPFYEDNWHDIQGYARLVENRILALQELFPTQPTDDLTQEERANDKDYIASLRDSYNSEDGKPNNVLCEADAKSYEYDKMNDPNTDVGQYRG